MSKYFGNWAGEPRYPGDKQGREAIIDDFFRADYDFEAKAYKDVELPEGFPTEEEILFAGYETPCYEGYALVLYERDGKVYEVTGAHCSCYGLEDQWKPEETSWPALALRKHDAYDLPAPQSYHELVSSRLKEAA